MTHPSQLTPVQAWQLGYLSTEELRDLIADAPADLEAYGRALSGRSSA